MVRNCGLADRKVLDHVADANRVAIGGKKVEDADAGRVGEGFEPARIFSSACVRELWRGGRAAAGGFVRGEFGCTCQGIASLPALASFAAH